MSTDWLDWHRPYGDATSALSRRLRVVQGWLGRWLDGRAGAVDVVSVCAGQGQDVIGVLARRADAGRVRATLLEYDERNVRAARAAADAAGLSGLDIRCADAGELASYGGAVPADLILMAGVFGNISDADIRHTVRTLPALCRPEATVIWTRTRRPPDRTGAIRDRFAAAGFAEDDFVAPDDVEFSVGVHRLVVPPAAPAVGRLFRFTR
jgi:Putative methyltransferase